MDDCSLLKQYKFLHKIWLLITIYLPYVAGREKEINNLKNVFTPS